MKVLGDPGTGGTPCGEWRFMCKVYQDTCSKGERRTLFMYIHVSESVLHHKAYCEKAKVVL